MDGGAAPQGQFEIRTREKGGPSINQINELIHQSNQSINQPTNQSIQSTNQSNPVTHQPIPPFPANPLINQSTSPPPSPPPANLRGGRAAAQRRGHQPRVHDGGRRRRAPHVPRPVRIPSRLFCVFGGGLRSLMCLALCVFPPSRLFCFCFLWWLQASHVPRPVRTVPPPSILFVLFFFVCDNLRACDLWAVGAMCCSPLPSPPP